MTMTKELICFEINLKPPVINNPELAIANLVDGIDACLEWENDGEE